MDDVEPVQMHILDRHSRLRVPIAPLEHFDAEKFGDPIPFEIEFYRFIQRKHRVSHSFPQTGTLPNLGLTSKQRP